jgi:hypothetical protein
VGAGIYAWYAVTQYDSLNDLNQRQLSNAAAEVKAAVENAVVTVDEFDRRWAESADDTKPDVCDFARDQPYLELRECAQTGQSTPVHRRGFSTAHVVLDPALAIEIGGESERRRFRYRIEKLLQELAFPDSFALIFVATSKGDVLYEDAPALRQWLRSLRWGEKTFRDTQAERPPSLQIHNVRQVLGDEATWNAMRAVSSRATVALRETSHELYLQPLRLEGGEPIELVMGGAVPRASVVRDALALGAPMLGVLVFVFLLGLLGFPFVKLACLDLHERFRLRDVKLLYVSSGALLVLFTCASLAVDGYVRWRTEADRGLEALANHLQTRFLNEVKTIRDWILAYDREVSAKTVNDCTAWTVHTKWFADERADGLRWPRDVHLKTVAWIEPGGRQIWKSTADTVSGKTPVGNRVYFRAVRDANLFQVDAGSPLFLGPDRSIADGRFYTFISMPSQVAPTLCADPTATRGIPVVAATTQLLSLAGQPLPAGYGFALVNREGRVLYHSDGRLSLRENLFEELSDGPRVRAMMYAGRRALLDTRYRERPHRLFLEPIRLSRAGDGPAVGSAFYLAVFRDASIEQALVGHVFVVGLLGPMTLLLGTFFLGLAFLEWASRDKGHGWSTWVWPHGGLDHVYKAQAAAFLLLLVGMTAIYMMYGTVIPFLLLPVFASAIGVAIYWQGARRKGPRRRLATPVWQRSSVLLALVCMIVVPSAALFRLALSHEFAKLVLTERDWVEMQTDDLLRAARVEALEERYAEARTRELLAARHDYMTCVPAPFDARGDQRHAEAAQRPEVVHAGNGGTQAPWQKQARPTETAALESCVADTSPGVRAASASLESMGLGTAAVEALRWFDDLLPVENEILARQHFQEYGQMYSPEGTIIPSFRASGIALVGFFATLGLLAWWIGWNSNRLFLADVDAPGTTPPGTCEEIWGGCSDDEKNVLTQLVHERIANPYQRSIVLALLDKGLLRMNPDVQPFSPAFEAFLRTQAAQRQSDVLAWERVNVRRSWRYSRVILAGAVAGVGVFLVATQPGLQSSVMAIASGITGLLTAGAKLRDSVTSWLGNKTAS